ncbi:hypothetical protein G6N05_07245 [Flavobacterium sp. F372]|jgi:hypothetical protein|uniref:Uncharacterized protein n=1 Tax=Flavobacterium bernardetii TaxID=2813823 RepID=A0ABR7IXF9_9FLAO|nr:hypothetical protein [Flavobacterium bernardetii]MBC5834460.1 hypothetical protein [Flavobacterium bernardetii]NHF69901.1 hypothetical protein [Flavobacterium bernardetii]
MTDKNKLDENQIWTLVMIVLPCIILMNAGKELTNESGMQILYSGVFGGLGAGLGLLANYLTKNKSRSIKILATTLIITLCVLIIRSLN